MLYTVPYPRTSVPARCDSTWARRETAINNIDQSHLEPSIIPPLTLQFSKSNNCEEVGENPKVIIVPIGLIELLLHVKLIFTLGYLGKPFTRFTV